MATEEKNYCESLIQTADSDLRLAEELLGMNKFDATVFYAALAGENAANALLIALGGRPSKRHRLDAALNAYFKTRPGKTPAKISEVIKKLKWLEPHVLISRYPVKVKGKWAAPSARYRKSDAKRATEYARKILETAKLHAP